MWSPYVTIVLSLLSSVSGVSSLISIFLFFACLVELLTSRWRENGVPGGPSSLDTFPLHPQDPFKKNSVSLHLLC